MKVNFLLAAVAAQQSTFGGFTFNVSGNIYTSNGIWGNYDSYISSERVTLAACISDCKFNAQCTGFTYNDETCTLKDVRLDEFQFTSVGAFPYDVTGFVLDKNYGCSDINGQVSCQPDPDNSALTNSGSTSNFQGFTMSVSQGMYLSTNCNFKQSSIVMNATIAGNESEKTCQSGLRKYSGQYAYSYDTKNNFCYKYDLRLQNLTMVSNSSSNCGFYLPTSKMCYDDGTNVLCSLNATGPNNTTSSNDSSGSNTGLIVGVICGVLIAVVLAGLGLVYYRKKSSPMSNKAFTPAQSFSSGINTPPNNVQHPTLQYNYSAVPQNNVHQSYDRNSYVQGMSSSATTISPNYQRMSGNLSELSQHTPKIVAVESTYPQPFIQPQLYNPPYQPSPTVIQQPPILNQNFIPEQVHAVPSQLPILTPVGNGNRAPDLSYSIQPPLMNNPPSAATPIDGQCEDIPPPILDTHHQ